MLQIPIQPYPAFVEEITLEGTPYRLSFIWNSRGAFWNLVVSDRQNTPLLSVKVVLGYPLLLQFPDRGLPLGEFVVVDTSDSASNTERIEYDDFTGERGLGFIYATEEEENE